MNQRELFVQKTFDRIAQRYDLLNRVISFHLDTAWRNRALAELGVAGSAARILDLGTGTGDLALAAAKTGAKIVGLDLSKEMVRRARAKTARAGLEEKISYVIANALVPPFKSESFDGIITAFVLRNVSDLELFFASAHALLKPEARFVSLEMFPPRTYLFSFFYSLYFYRLVPWIGAGLARNHEAYRYLADSVRGFCSPAAVSEALERAGFVGVRLQRYLCGAVCLHSAVKPATRSEVARDAALRA
ncbi:MAG TPA: ubiquinone/menaquinone biosynthesis methyltransferase [Candidatus Acidoferrales bacterium]|nr:ubiquinone/menaquinone biosynthesis methyltransferase [Candidatus Acidoferrales bacterium]